MLEIGSGLGFISILCSQRAGEGLVLSYEANPALQTAIEGNYRLNGLTPNLRMRAVTVEGQPISFFQNANVISSSLLDRENDARKITVESDPINGVIAVHSPDVIVMDVEGAEVDLLEAADLSGVRAIVVETHEHIVGADKIAAMITALAAKGLRCSADDPQERPSDASGDMTGHVAGVCHQSRPQHRPDGERREVPDGAGHPFRPSRRGERLQPDAGRGCARL